MKIASSFQMRSIDKEAIEGFGIPGVVLMENAGAKVASTVLDNTSRGDKVSIVCGRGNNGGDGFVAARHLSFTDRSVDVFLLGCEEGLKGDALVNYGIIKKMNLNIVEIKDSKDIPLLVEGIKKSRLVVDGILGTGVRGEVSSFYRDAIKAVNENGKLIISIDIPSGIDSDTGKVLGEAVKAHITVTFEIPKIGLYTYPGAEYAGRVQVEPISIPRQVIEKHNINVNLLTKDDVKNAFPKRKCDSNKGTYGRACIVAGSKNMPGAALMCILGALRSGAGLLEAAVPSSIKRYIAPFAMEAIFKELQEEDGRISMGAFDQIMESLRNASSYAIGPGISQSPELFKLLEKIICEAQIPGVIDADGLNLMSQNVKILRSARSFIIVTPHPGEMARLLGRDVKSIQEDRIGCAKEFSREYGVVTLLKGANTVISSPDGEVFINPTGNPGMAKGGSGDVLTGIIASLLAQGLSTFDAARIGAYIHGLAGDIAKDKLGEYGMKASDIIDSVPAAIMQVQERV